MAYAVLEGYACLYTRVKGLLRGPLQLSVRRNADYQLVANILFDLKLRMALQPFVHSCLWIVADIPMAEGKRSCRKILYHGLVVDAMASNGFKIMTLLKLGRDVLTGVVEIQGTHHALNAVCTAAGNPIEDFKSHDFLRRKALGQ
jgi:hypothetical protein